MKKGGGSRAFGRTAAAVLVFYLAAAGIFSMNAKAGEASDKVTGIRAGAGLWEAAPIQPDEIDGAASWTGQEKVSELKGTSSTEGTVLTWAATPGAEGYLIGAIQNGNQYAQIGYVAGGDKTSYTDKNASLTMYSYYWVFPYCKVNGKVVPGSRSDRYVYGYTQLAAPEEFNTAPGEGKVLLSWKTVDGADGYIIKCRRGSSGAVKEIANTADAFFKDENAPQNDTSYYWIYAYKSPEGRMYPGKTSNYVFGKANPVEQVTTLDKSDVTIKAGESDVVNIKLSRGVEIFAELDDASIADMEWGSWINNSTIELKIKGLKKGNTAIHITNAYNKCISLINVTIE
ncbi:MAG: hypothetical protein IKN57_04555 [Parasporobacterium sp.]|nr:hypothetical protein [Parasporobacterium sp.]